MTLSVGTRLGPYEILGLVGAGGMGEVYRAGDPRLGREVAVKVLPTGVASDPERLLRFEREARAVAALNHPNVLTVFDVGTQRAEEGAGGAAVPYVVTELLEGETLRELLSHRSPNQRQILSLAAQVARGLDAAHAKGIVHRDLKPENVFVTTDGRAKVLDFGLAKLVDRMAGDTGEETASSPTGAGRVLGTVGYMSPEQVRGLPVDHRTDLFSLGVVLYELLSGKHPFRRDTTIGTLTAILEETPAELAGLGRGIPPALGGLVSRCLEKDRGQRFRSAHDLALSLEAVVQAPAGAASLQEVEERSPYPGLMSFTEKDAAFFFGREQEAVALWGKVKERRLLGVIAPSGAGKTSLVRAGVVASRPEGWATVVCTPGASPLRGLGRALVPELSGDPEALGKLVDVDDPAVAFEVVSRWRKAHGEALLVVDQFEELFTLNPEEVQARFAALLGRLAGEADVHVLLSLRDDFLIRCSEHEPLTPVFRDLTPLPALSAEGLGRALEGPAKKRGYRFEDEALVAEMVESVEGARGALPLLAFAVSRLWEKRDRERKCLTRAAYEEVGGVAGALAQHAEATLDRIGATREPIVREIFRNLVTSLGTRAVAEHEELLSLFPDRKAAEEVLRELVDARLLTSYEVASAEGGAGGRADAAPEGVAGPQTKERHSVEIVHESLLKAWPRLVRWQAQDEEGSLLRDQLKQAAHLWQEKSHSPDLLWSGRSFREYELWRERYQGQLTALEEQFAKAMTDRWRRARRLRQAAVAALVVSLGAVAIVVSILRHQAVQQARRAEASKLVALGRNQLDAYPTAALAYARKSLEVADTAEGRRLAVEALWRSPTARILPIEHGGSWGAAFSRDGHRLAAYTFSEFVLLFEEDGSPPRALGGFKPPFSPTSVSFTPDGTALVAWAHAEPEGRMVSVPDGREIRRLRPELPAGRPGIFGGFGFLDSGVLVAAAESPAPDARVHLGLWPWDGGPPALVGALHGGSPRFTPDERGLRLAVRRGDRLFVRPLAGGDATPERDAGVIVESPIWSYRISPGGDRLAVGEESGRLSVWPLDTPDATKPRELRFANPDPQSRLAFDPSGSLLSWGSSADKEVGLWDLSAPPDAAPRLLRRPDASTTKATSFHPRGDWLAVLNYGTATFWAIRQPWPRVMRGPTGQVFQIAFTPDSRELLSCAFDGVHLWPLDPARGSGQRRISKAGICYTMALSPDGRELLWGADGVSRTGLASGEDRPFQSNLSSQGRLNEVTRCVAIDRSGRRAATATGYTRPPAHKFLRIWDWPSGQKLKEFPLAPPGEAEDPWFANSLTFDASGRVLVAGGGGIRRFDAETGASEWIRRVPTATAWAQILADAPAMVAAEDAGLLSVLEPSSATSATGRYVVVNPGSGDARPIASHGTGLTAVGIDRSGRILVSGDDEGAVRVGRADGSEPHLLLGPGGRVQAVALSPDGRWVASASGSEIRLWPMPDLSKPPLHTLPHEELMAKLHALTNLRVVEDAAAATGYKLDVGPFPGWKDVPMW